jgi:uncharacterized membrane protein
VVILLQLSAEPLAGWLGLPAAAILPYRILLLGVGAQAISLLGLIVLYYFDLRREACLAAGGLLLQITAFTVAAAAWGLPPGLGTALGGLLGACMTWSLVFRGANEALEHTLLGQPLAVEARRKRTAPRPRQTIVR